MGSNKGKYCIKLLDRIWIYRKSQKVRGMFLMSNVSEKRVRLWDPFCGSGTILLQAFSMFLDLPIREPFEKDFICKAWPVFDSEVYKEYKHKVFSGDRFQINESSHIF